MSIKCQDLLHVASKVQWCNAIKLQYVQTTPYDWQRSDYGSSGRVARPHYHDRGGVGYFLRVTVTGIPHHVPPPTHVWYRLYSLSITVPRLYSLMEVSLYKQYFINLSKIQFVHKICYLKEIWATLLISHMYYLKWILVVHTFNFWNTVLSNKSAWSHFNLRIPQKSQHKPSCWWQCF